MRRKVFVGFLVCVCAYIYFGVATASHVTQVKDGDSIVVQYGEEVRLMHIDAPEWNQPWGDRATEFVKERCLGKQVKLRRHGKDKYGRTLAEVILPGGVNLNHELVKEGLAWHYRRYSHDRFYQLLEQEARSKKKGLWSDPDPTAPWDWRVGVR